MALKFKFNKYLSSLLYRLLVWLKCKYLSSTFLLALKYVFFLSVDNNFLHPCILYLVFQLSIIKSVLLSPFMSEYKFLAAFPEFLSSIILKQVLTMWFGRWSRMEEICEANDYLSLLFLLNWNMGNQSHVDFGFMERPDLKLWTVNSLKETELGFHLCV